jgi:Raf kinase inhibitor-like YbhB/YbcL family protein
MRAAWALQGLGYLILGVIIYIAIQNNTPSKTPEAAVTSTNPTLPMNDQKFLIRSPAFQNEQRIPSKYTCDGDDISPPLAIENIPESTASMVLLVDDPDAPSGTWTHWLVFNIPRDVTRIGEGTIPIGTRGNTSWSTTDYGGPCPPEGTHRYSFKIYALGTTLRLNEGASKQEVLEALKGHILAESELIGTYERSRE